MKKFTLFFFALFILSSCNSDSGTRDEETNEGVNDGELQDQVIHLGTVEENSSEVYRNYFSDLDDYPLKDNYVGNKEGDIYWQKANGSRLREEQYFPNENFAHYIYDSAEDSIEIAYILLEGATLQNMVLKDELYVSWIYDFNEQKVNNLIQENKNGESQDIINFSDDEWEDFSTGHKEFLLQLLR